MLLFDIGRTLMDNTIHPVQCLSEHLELDNEQKNKLKKNLFCFDDKNNYSDLIRLTELTLGLNFSISQKIFFKNVINDQFKNSFAMSGSLEFCDILMKTDIPYGFVSNIWKPFYAAFKETFSEFDKNATNRFLSFQMGCKKPEAEFYDKVFSSIKCHPHEVTVIGDNLKNDITPFLERGCKAIWFNVNKDELNCKNDDFEIVKDFDELSSVLKIN